MIDEAPSKTHAPSRRRTVEWADPRPIAEAGQSLAGIDFLRAATGRSGLLTAVGHVIHSGRQQVVAEGRLSDESGRLVATASTTCLVFDLPGAGKQASAADRAEPSMPTIHASELHR